MNRSIRENLKENLHKRHKQVRYAMNKFEWVLIWISAIGSLLLIVRNWD